MLLQKITTREPDDDMLEVAITAFNTVIAMDNDPTIPEQEFIVAEKLSSLLNKVSTILRNSGINEEAEAEWIVSLTLGIKRDELNNDKIIQPKSVEKVLN